MNWREDVSEQDRELGEAIAHFKASIDAWSDAAQSQPRTIAYAAARRSRWWTASWAIGSVLTAALLAAAGVRQAVHRQTMASRGPHRAIEQAATEPSTAAPEAAPPVSAQTGEREPADATVSKNTVAQNDALLASVDRDLSREVPAAMEPLAQLMNSSAPQRENSTGNN